MAGKEFGAMHFGGSHKGHFNADPKLQYCINHSYKLHPIQEKLAQATMDHPRNYMLGATEVIQTCTCLIKQMHGKKVLDIGTFTGFSALSWALAVPDDGQVVTMDVSDDAYKAIGKQFIEESGLAKKIDVRIQPALKTLDELIATGQSGTFDFAFLDADKTEYPKYYEKCLQLLRPGGIIAVDNALWGGHVATGLDPDDKLGHAIDNVNNIIAGDPRVNNIMLPIGDGLHLAFKK